MDRSMNTAATSDVGATSGFGPIRQVGYVVADLAASVAQWHRSHGLGRWVCFRNVEMAAQYRGRPNTLKMHVALAYQDELEIELIEPRSFVDSPYVDAGGRPTVGPNHLAWFSSDLDADIARAQQRGLEAIFVAHNPVTRVAYLEPPGEPGVRYELIEYTADGLEGWRERVRAAREGGSDLCVIEIDLAALP
jgi:methylmalonyl-CoA/ethylmalonyl-CoA epimerase